MSLRPISTNGAPAAIGPYSQAVDIGALVFCSGQLGLDPATGELASGVEAQTERALRNIAAILDSAGLTLMRVVKTTVLLADMADFARVNEVYARHFSDPLPARATYAVAALPRGGLVEIEAVAAR